MRRQNSISLLPGIVSRLQRVVDDGDIGSAILVRDRRLSRRMAISPPVDDSGEGGIAPHPTQVGGSVEGFVDKAYYTVPA